MRRAAWEVFRAFLALGLVSFGGPAAHVGYFRTEFVSRRRWLDEPAYADLLGLCQFLPGPASSQVGFAIGLLRAGWLGGVAAWTGFTLPSAVLMTLFAYGAGPLQGSPAGIGLLHGLKLAAVAVVAQALWGMARTLCPDRPTGSIAVAALALAALVPGTAGQVSAIILAALAGLAVCPGEPGRESDGLAVALPRWTSAACLTAFGLLLAGSLLWRGELAAAFYRSGALVFGGGHVVLPLLQDAVVAPGWVSADAFLAGYGAAQAMPGPLFTIAAYLGAEADGLPGAALALVAVFLPGLLLVAGILPSWHRLRRRPGAQAALRGVNAAVVGLLGAAFYAPVWTGGVRGPADLAVAVAAFVLLTAWRTPPALVVGLCALAGLSLTPS